ncbi:YqaJ viral recombinase family protein [Actinomadura sp. LOL_016]|uniref:YqaJ viral recombinase family nuclease n=1 Tax=unclassified Actinomadura TaxID=2626254 RepID=UPI003A7F92C2
MTILDSAPLLGAVHGSPHADLVLPYDAPRPLWLEARRAGIGGSDALACLGLDGWKTRLEVYLDKVGRLTAKDQTKRMRWGQIVEASILEWFTEETGIPSTRIGLMRSKTRSWQLASVDAESADGGIVEIKNTNYHRRDEWEDEQVSDGAEAQSQHYLAVTGRSHAWVVAQIGGEPPVIRRVERDENLIATICASEQELWELVEARTPPPLEGGAASEDLVKRLFPHGVPGKRVEVDTAFMVKLRDHKAASKAEGAAKKRKESLRDELAYVMGDATEAWHDGECVATRKNQTKTNAPVTVLRQKHPEVAAEVVTEKTSRVFSNKLKETP